MVAVLPSGAISTAAGMPASETRSAVVAATRLNECPVPRARTRSAATTSLRSSVRLVGVCTRTAPSATLPAQLCVVVVIAAECSAPARSAELLVDVAPAPRLAGFDAAHDRVPGAGEVRVGVPAGARVAAGDVPVGQAHAQVHPLDALVNALLADAGRVRTRGARRVG